MKTFILMERDKELLQFLFENKVSTRKQVFERFFKNISPKNANRRIRKLMKEKLISSKGEEIGGRFKQYLFVGGNGIDIVRTRNKLYTVDKIEKSESIQHDLELLELRYLLCRSPKVKSYFTENMLQGIFDFKNNDDLKYFVRLNSDAAILISLKIGPIYAALEYETLSKSDSRYEKKIREYYESNISIVIYVTKSEILKSRILRIDDQISRELKRPNKVFCATYDTLLSNPKKLTFVNSNGKILDLLS